MNSQLLDDNYILIPKFISPYRANQLADDFKKYSKEENLTGDSQVPLSETCYNYKLFLELLCEKTPEISEIINEPVLPTYCYSRIYKNGNILEPHTDRESCEISLTINLSCDEIWPIYINTPKDETKQVNLNPGDAMVYLGTIASHWREKYEGNELVQVFLHYVKSRGDNFEFYFDKKNMEKRDEQKNDDDNTTEKEIEILEDNIVDDSNEQFEESNKITYFQPLTDFISVFDNVIPVDICDKIVKEYENCPYWLDSVIASKEVNATIRNCSEINISSNEIISKNYEYRKFLDDTIFQYLHESASLYSKKHGNLLLEQDTGYTLLRYGKDQFYTQHTDSFLNQPRTISCSFSLVDDYEGGEFSFFDRQIIIKPKKGSLLIFPSNFMFPHEILPVTSGTRYSVITWMT
jgi:predicted 2-oxoglutarate/Fe(II)-dependent dioxygenase YbiX